jgi:hypothetical protein
MLLPAQDYSQQITWITLPTVNHRDGGLDQPDTQDDGLEIEICTVCEKTCFVKVKCSMCSKSVHEMCSKANADLVVCHLCSNEVVISEERRNASVPMR